jgi:hypothetical protein
MGIQICMNSHVFQKSSREFKKSDENKNQLQKFHIVSRPKFYCSFE